MNQSMQLKDRFEQAVEAARALNLTDRALLDRVLLALADATQAQCDTILQANALDLAAMDPANPMYDRLLLTPQRIEGIATEIRHVASLPSPLDEALSEVTRPNGMVIRKVSVPFGVVGAIYEARPNVSFDLFALCLKSGNACILKGGSDARHSNEAIVALIQSVLRAQGLNEHTVTLLPANREATAELLTAVGYVDLLIPRGSRALIDYVREHARIPMIETGAGICHTYFDCDGDLSKGAAIVLNAKTRRVSVCNALDCLIVHRDRLGDLSTLCDPLSSKQVKIYVDPEAYAALQGRYPAELLLPANADSFGTEFLSYALSIRTVGSLTEALEHIASYSSKHSEAIVTENPHTALCFQRAVDAACVYVNVSTAFTDGAQFGLGAEVGISTQKLHARGPMALREMTTYKYLITGSGQVRE